MKAAEEGKKRLPLRYPLLWLACMLFAKRRAGGRAFCETQTSNDDVCAIRGFWALIAVAACLQNVDVYHIKNRRL